MKTTFNFQVLEDTRDICDTISCECWFITQAGRKQPIRRELYKLKECGLVVALIDTGVDLDNSLWIEDNFFDQFFGEPEVEAILQDQGIIDPTSDRIHVFRMEQ